MDRVNPSCPKLPRADPGGCCGSARRTGTPLAVSGWHGTSLRHLLPLSSLLKKFPFFPLQIFYRALRDVQPGEELTVWYSNPLAQWFDIPVTATPTHDEKGTDAGTHFRATKLNETKQNKPSLADTFDGISNCGRQT